MANTNYDRKTRRIQTAAIRTQKAAARNHRAPQAAAAPETEAQAITRGLRDGSISVDWTPTRDLKGAK